MKHSQRNTAFYIEILALLLMLIFGLTVVIQVFGYARKMSSEAKALASAVPLAENAAEVFIAGENKEPVECYYDKDWKECDKRSSIYTLRLDFLTKEEKTGQMQDITVTVSGKDEVIYELNTKKYIDE